MRHVKILKMGVQAEFQYKVPCLPPGLLLGAEIIMGVQHPHPHVTCHIVFLSAHPKPQADCTPRLKMSA